MYKTEKKCRTFDLLDAEHQEAYADILNNPLSSILSERVIKKTECAYSDGEMISKSETIYLVVVWEEKSLL